ncbi:7135_t:CDS:1, partial [Rhizophagus irregularis]
AVNSEQKPLLQVPDNNESILNAPSLKEDIVMADSTKIKEINTTSTSHVLPENIRLEHAIKAYASAQKKNSQIYWPKPLEINFLQIKDADDVATISCKVGSVTIPYAMIDSGSDSSIVSENVAKHLGLKIDKKKIHRLNGVASKSHSLGTVDSVP